nr:PREDICTED: serpin E3 [Latimeria chalumnae]|eukprot:XP_014350259.1 PREDICTED: serpin E3 [Latimeria chalumnae]
MTSALGKHRLREQNTLRSEPDSVPEYKKYCQTPPLKPVTKLFLYLWVLHKGCCDLQDTFKELSTEFAVNFYKKAAESENETNLVVSPVSVSVLLELLQFGAQGNTFIQLENVLGYNMHDWRVRDFLCKIYEDVTTSTPTTAVQLASSLFVQAGIPLSPDFTEQISGWVNSSLQQANFSEPNRTAAQINQWLHVKSRGNDLKLNHEREVRDLIFSDMLGSPVTQIAVVSVMYFKSTWQKPFTFANTQNLPFTTADASVLKVPMMYQTAEVNYGQFKFASEEHIAVLELPYLGNAVSMFVVLPSNRKTPLSLIEPYLTASAILLWTNNMRRMKMDIFLPRFKLQNKLNLKIVLPALGITDPFDPLKADFRGISDQENLYVSEAIHKAKIEVTEDGTRASAAAAMVLLKRSRAPVFKADRPFLFLLRQADTGVTLFMGRVVNPLE